jgi:hypothetical protein
MNYSFMFETMVNAMICIVIGSLTFMNCCCVKNLVIGLRLDQLFGILNSL